MNRRDVQPVSFASEPSVQDRLDSWKEIAAYLKRDVRTVQRWEREEGLPVQRLHHKKQGTVYAQKSDLDAWMQQRGSSVQRKDPTRLTGWRQRRRWALAAVAVLVVSYVVWQSREPQISVPEPPLKIVVLPFENLSGDTHQEYFSDGVTEEIIGELGRINPTRLMVIARTSAMAYKNTRKSAFQITQELGVDYLLEGSVRREGDRVRITVQLIAGEGGSHLWAESYDIRLASILDTQRQVASTVSRKIQVSLDAASTAGEAPLQVNPEAYEALLLGRHHFSRWSPDGFLKASGFFAEAVRRQPDYALAHAHLSTCHSMLGFYGLLSPEQAAGKARAAANRAMELDRNLGQAHQALGLVKALYDLDWPGAGQSLEKAVELLPGSSEASSFYGYYLATMGRHAESIAVMRKAEVLDFLSPLVMTNLADAYRYARRYDDALRQLEKVLELEPNYPRTQLIVEAVYEMKGMYQEAAAARGRYLSLTEAGASSSGRLPAALAPQNPTRDTYWKWKLQQLESYPAESDAVSLRSRALGRAKAYAALGDRERALFWLEKAQQEGLPLFFLKVNAHWDPLRDTPRFQELLRRINFPP